MAVGVVKMEDSCHKANVTVILNNEVSFKCLDFPEPQNVKRAIFFFKKAKMFMFN